MAEFKVVTEADFNSRHRKTKQAFRAISAAFDALNRQVVVQLSNGASAGFPIDKIRGLETASAADLNLIEVQGRGFSLHVPSIDADLSMAQLFADLLGSSVMIQAERRMIASRVNGKKGGRPKLKGSEAALRA